MNLKKLLIPVAVILACAVVLFAANAAFAGTAESNRQEEFDTILEYVIPGGGEYEVEEYTGSDESIVGVYRGAQGVAVEMTVAGFADDIHLLVGLFDDGTVYSVSVLEAHETYGLGQKAKDDWDFLGSLLNSQGGLGIADVDAITGATITSSAVMSAVNSASSYIADSGTGTDGTLTGEGSGFGGPITVEVTMDGDDITSVTIVSNSETPSIAANALEQIPAAIVEADTADVDIVAGATYTSNGIINAVKDALSKAGGGTDGALTGTADGFIGPITVEVTMDGDTITSVTVVDNSETLSIASGALEQIPEAIVAANSPDVDVVAGATYTSNGIINAVKNALEGASSDTGDGGDTVEPVEAAEAYLGFGLANTVRMGPGSDDTGTPVYSINQVFADVVFDGDGRILSIYVDQLEYATPNYDGSTMPHFSGWPGQGGYNNDANHDAVVDGTTPDTEEQFTSEVEGWVTKRDRGDSYVMGTGTWSEQMDTFQELFVGMTVDEIEDWFATYCSDANGRPLQESSSGEGDADKYTALSDDDKAMLADITASATMSLNDSHGNIIAAIRDAYENRVPLESGMTVSGTGFGLANTVRMGPGSDDTGTPVYSINQVFANTLFDSEGRIVAIYVDQLEYATPNYDGSTMPHFSGWPGQGGYNNDANHDAVVDGTTPDTEEQFTSEVEGWVTKRDRGDSYVMGTGTWSEQMDTFQELFVGMTVDEIEDWFATYCSDANGRPLQESSSGEGDADKYAALSDDDKAMLADITASATMSLNDSHGNILAAILDSFENQVAVDITVG